MRTTIMAVMLIFVLIAGYLVITAMHERQETIKENINPEGATLSVYEALQIAMNDCGEEGQVLENYVYNKNTNTYWFDTTIKQEGCAPACVVDETTKTAEINYRCTGLLP